MNLFDFLTSTFDDKQALDYYRQLFGAKKNEERLVADIIEEEAKAKTQFLSHVPGDPDECPCCKQDTITTLFEFMGESELLPGKIVLKRICVCYNEECMYECVMEKAVD